MLKPNLAGKLTSVYRNVGAKLPWANYKLPSRERNRPKIIGLVIRFFKLYRADPKESQQARMPRFPSVHTQLLN